MIPYLFCAAVLAFDLPEIIRDKAIDYAKEKGMEAIDSKVVDGVEEKIKDLLHDPYGSKKAELEDIEASQDAVQEQAESFFHEFDPSEEDGGPIGAVDPYLLAERKKRACEIQSGPISFSHEKPVTSMDYIEGSSKSANGTLMHDAMKKIVDGAAYAYIISLETVSPLTTSAMKQIQTWANQLNAMSLQSNELAGLLSPVGRAEREASFLYEQALAASNQIDLVAARRAFLEKKKKGEQLFENGHFHTLMAGDYDVAEKVLSLTDYSERMKNLVLTLTGTICAEEGSVKIYPPLYPQAILYLQTGEPLKKAYGWDKGTIKLGSSLPETVGEKQRVTGILKSIQQKLLSDEDLSLEEKKLLESSSLPMAHLIALLTQYKGTGAQLALDRYGDLIAYERVVCWVEGLVADCLEKAKALHQVQVCSAHLQHYIEQIEGVLKGIDTLKIEHHRKMEQEQQAVNTLMQLNQALNEKGMR